MQVRTEREFPGAVLYQLRVRTFTPAGTFAAATEHAVLVCRRVDRG